MGGSITFVEIQCLSKVKSGLLFCIDTLKTSKSYAKQHFMRNLQSKKRIFKYFYEIHIFSKMIGLFF